MAVGRIFTGKKVSLTIAFAVLLAAAFGAGCNGFFVDPTLTSLNIIPASPSVQLSQTTSLSAYAVNSNQQGKTLTSGVSWSTSDPTIAQITGACANGVLCGSATVEGLSASTVTITASSQNLTATATLNVFLPNVTNFQVCQGTFGSTTCSSGSTALTWHAGTGGGTSQTFVAQGQSSGTTYNLTTSSTWTVSAGTSSISCTNSGSGATDETCTVPSGTANNTYPVTVTYNNSSNNATATLNIVVP
jgi:hypothetical protein